MLKLNLGQICPFHTWIYKLIRKQKIIAMAKRGTPQCQIGLANECTTETIFQGRLGRVRAAVFNCNTTGQFFATKS